MMRKSVLVLLIVSTLLVMDAEAWFRLRRTIRRESNTVKKVVGVTKKAVGKVTDWVKKHETLIRLGITVGFGLGKVIGKRSADIPPGSQEEEEEKREAVQLLEELERDCPTFDIDALAGLTREAVLDAVDSSDVNEDGVLDDEEFEFFESVVEVYEQCVELELARKVIRQKEVIRPERSNSTA